MKEKKYNYNDLLSAVRMGAGSRSGTRNIEAFYSDRTRILYCSAFRRLQQKAQVFSMETNSSVRSRLTHSLEVSDLGRKLANGIAYRLKNRGWLTETNIPVVVAIVENACLLHDIGNPPFGHFGESAIQDWAVHKAAQTVPEGVKYEGLLAALMQDFVEFDGNPQGFRTVTKLFTDFDRYGLDLTCATLLCGLKYARTTGEPKGKGIMKKAGFFRTEADLVQKLLRHAEMEPCHRYPLTYIMEAADDIAYCMSDIADGIEKRILTEEEFVRTFARKWREKYPDVPYPKEIANLLKNPEQMHGFNRDFSIPWSTRATEEAVQTYMDRHEAVFVGTADALISDEQPMGKVLKTISCVCGELLYPSIEAESIELTGYAVITGILRHYERLLKLPYADFARLIRGERKGMAVEVRLYNRIDSRCVEAYRYGVDDLKDDPDFAEKEWWLRVHLLIDHISSMTDAYALETYQMLEGIALMRT